MTDWKTIVSIVSLGICFLLSPLLFPSNPGISEKLMYALFAVVGLPAVATGIRIVRGRND